MPRLSKILDPATGKPVDLDELFGPPRAGPTLTGVRSPISGHPAEGLTPMRLAAIHRAAAAGDPLAYLELAEDIEERDLHYLGVIGTRKRSVAQLPITVEAASEDAEHVRHADFLRAWIAEGLLQIALFDILDAVGKGFSVQEIEWESSAERIAPGALTWRNPAWFGFDPLDGETVMLLEGTGKVPLSPHLFIVHRHKAKSGLTIRSGLARVASWAWMYKSFTLKDWAIFVQNYGQPIRLGRYDATASDEDRGVLWRAVANVAGDCAAIIPKSMELEFVQAMAAEKGSELYEKRADWMDRQVSKAVLGQTTTTDAVSGGHAVAKEHRLVQEDIERADAMLLSATITRQLGRPMVAFNFGPQKAYPRVVVGRPDELPIGDVVEAIYKLGPLGLTVEASQLRDRLGFSEPAKGTEEKPVEVVGGRAPPPVVVEPRPGLPRPPRPDLQARGMGALRYLVSRHASAPEPEYVERLTARLAEDAAGALGGLTAEIRAALDEAVDLHDAATRLAALELSPQALADAMGRAMALAHLVGQAALLDELGER